MNSISGRKWLLLAFAASTLMLAACDSIKDVKFQPSIPPQPRNHVLRGVVSGLTTKPVVLHYAGPTEDDEKEISVGVNGPFSFSAVPEGSYTITVESNPIGKLCEIENASGTITGTVTDVTVTCAPDPDAPVYKVSGTVVGLAASATDLELELDSDAGLETVSVAGGGASFAFTSELLTDFDYAVTVKTAPTTGGGSVVHNCVVSGGAGTIVDSDIVNVQVTCGFEVSVSVRIFAAPFASDLSLALKDTFGTTLATATVPTGSAGGPSPVVVPFSSLQISSNSASYVASVTSQPSGETCVLANGGAVSLITPAPVAITVLCSGVPAPANALTGTYSTGRTLVTFMNNGTYLAGSHGTTTATTGVEHGVYVLGVFGPGTLAFYGVTDTNGAAGFTDPANNLGFLPAGISGGRLDGFAKVAGPPAQITGTGASGAIAATAVASTAGQLQGAWVNAEKNRAFVYNSTNGTVFHYGANGAVNLQDGCLTLGAANLGGTGSYTGNQSASCVTIPGGLAPVNTDPTLAQGGFYQFPYANGPGTFGVVVDYTIVAGSPDSLLLQPAWFFMGAWGAFGPPIGPFTRSEVN